jgi:hypothetical protein
MLQECTKCCITKPLTEFYFRKDTGRFRKDCKECKTRKVLKYQKEEQDTYHRNRKKSLYKITDDEYYRAMSLENCEICSRVLTIKNRNFDHCHETGSFRGILCNKCNISLGGLGDNVKGLKRALKYLEERENN